MKINCINCGHFYYDNNDEGHCDAFYKHNCLKLLQWRIHPDLFVEDVLGVKLKWYQKIYLKMLIKREK